MLVPDSEIGAILRRLDVMERNHSDLAKTITKLIEEMDTMRVALEDTRVDRAVRAERDIRINDRFDQINLKFDQIAKSTNERFDQIVKRIDAVYGLGRWVLGAFGALVLALITNFMFRGGFNVLP